MNLCHVFKCIVEEHETHWLVVKAIVFEHFIKLVFNDSIITQILIESGILGLLISRLSQGVVTKDYWISKNILFAVLEVLFNNVRHYGLSNEILISIVNELITEDSKAFIPPQSDKSFLSIEFVYC